MKRFFRFFAIAIVAMAVVGCNENTDEENTITITPEIAFQQQIDEYSNYDVDSVEEILCNKRWRLWSMASYDDNWNFNRFARYKGELYAIGCPSDSYEFNNDQTFLRYLTGYYKMIDGYHYISGEWSFDTETRDLTMTTTSVEHEEGTLIFSGEHNHEKCQEPETWQMKIIAINENMFICEQGRFRYEYIVVKE